MARILSISTAIAGAMFALASPIRAEAGEFDGVTVNIMTQTGAIQEPLQRRAPEFEKLTGAKINVIAVPFSDLYQKVLTDWASGTNSVDAAVFAPQWMVDYVSGGYLEELGPRIAKDKAIEWDQIGPFFRNFSATYGGKIYLVPLDGDFHMLYYRTDILDKAGLKPPKTWDEYLEVAKALNGKEVDGTKVYGSCIAKKRNAQSYWFITDVTSSMVQSKGTSQGTFFDTKDMRPLIDNEAFRKALEFLKEFGKYGPPDELNLDVSDTRPLFVSGKCALNLDWGDVGVHGDRSEDLEGHRQDGLRHYSRLEGGYELVDRQARGLHQGHVPLRHRRREPCSLRRVRRLERRHQRQGQGQGQGCGLCVPVLYVAAGTVERRRDDRRDRVQSLPRVPVHV